MTFMSKHTTLCTAEAKRDFRSAYRDSAYQAAVSLTDTPEEAERLTEALFQRMEHRFAQTPLPQPLPIYLLSQLNLLYAQRDSSAQGPKQPSQEETAELRSDLPPTDLNTTEQFSASIDEKSSVFTSAANVGYEEPLRANASFPQGMYSSPPFYSAYPGQGTQPGAFDLPWVYDSGRPQPYVPPAFPIGTLWPPQQPYAPYWTAMPFSFYAPMPARMDPRENVKAAPSAKSKKEAIAEPQVQFDPALTEFWQPDAEAAPSIGSSGVPRPIAPTPPDEAVMAAAPSALALSEPQAQNARSVPLSIVNSFLFLGVLTAIAYLLMELNVLPRLF